MSPNARCIAHLASGGWLLTPDLRQSRIFRRLHDRAQIAAGRVVWPSAQVMPFDGWLALQWRDAGAAAPKFVLRSARPGGKRLLVTRQRETRDVFNAAAV